MSEQPGAQSPVPVGRPHAQSPVPGEGPGAQSWVAEARAALQTGTSWRARLAKIPALRPRELVALSVLVTLIVCGAGVAFVRALPRGGDVPAETHAGPVPPDVAASPTASPGTVVVYVTGAVRSPGVYDFPQGARVIDALKRAGGPASNAAVESLNLAQPLVDGSRLYVPRKGEAAPPEAPGSGGGGTGGASAGAKVNVNTATAAELDAGLPGVGPVLAQRIVDYRTQHGPFRSVNDLMKVEGIGQKKFDSLKDYVMV